MIVSLLENAPVKDGPYEATGIAEAVMVPMAPAIANAVASALGVRIRALPLGPEQVLTAVRSARPPVPSPAG